MDIKISGITEEIMEVALSQAHEARLHILEQMNKVISQSRESLSENAPSMVTMKVHPDKIRDIIGKGGHNSFDSGRNGCRGGYRR